MEGLFGDGLVLFCCGDSLEEDLHWEPRLGAFVDLVELDDGVTSCGAALFKTVEVLCRRAFFFSTSTEQKQRALGQGELAVKLWTQTRPCLGYLPRDIFEQFLLSA